MQLDVFTVMMSICAVILLLGLQLLYFWSQDRRSLWLAWWSALFFAGGLGIACFMYRGVSPDMIGIRASNALTVFAFGCAWQGMRAFERRRPKMALVVAAPIVWLLLSAWPLFMETLQIRVVVASAITALFTSLGIFELWRGRAERLPSRPMVMAFFISLTLVFSARIALLNVLPFPLGGLTPTPQAVGIFNLIIFAHATSITLLMVAMTKERLELEQRNFALRDPLTGLFNRRAFLEQTKTMSRRRFAREPLSLLVLDLDHFKDVNDRYGHAMGDRVLASFGELALASIRPTDFFFRMGGEEFCCILPDASAEQAFQVAERIRTAFEATAIDGRGTKISATVSIGVASSEQMGHDLDTMYGSADAAVYAAKGNGRNMSVVAGSIAAMRRVG